MSAVPERLLPKLPYGDVSIRHLCEIREMFHAAKTEAEYAAAMSVYDTISISYKKKARDMMGAIAEHNSVEEEAKGLLEDLIGTADIPITAVLAVKDMFIGMIEDNDKQSFEGVISALEELGAIVAKEGLEKAVESPLAKRAKDRLFLALRQVIQKGTGRSSRHARKIIRRLVGTLRVAARVGSISLSVMAMLLNRKIMGHDEYGTILEIDKAQQRSLERLSRGQELKRLQQPALILNP